MSRRDAPSSIDEATTLAVGAPAESAPPGDGDRAQGAASALGRGATVGRYLILSLLGRGGMGAVYAAYDPELDRRVALKLLHTAGGYDARKLLAREARALGQLSHPNVVQVHDVGEHEGDVFVAMELVDGESLDAWCARAPRPSWQAVLAVYVDAARGLSAAHAKGLVHRDVKPANILRGRDGRVRVVDFGIAVGLAADAAGAEPMRDFAASHTMPGGSAADRLTEAGVVMGTPIYMAPEQLQPAGASPASDQYALSASLYEGLYGAPPFKLDPALPPGQALDDLFARKQAGAPSTPPADTPVPAWIWKVLARGLAPAPGDRYPSMGAFAAALAQDPAAPRRAFRRMIGVGALAGAFFVIGAAGWARSAVQSPCAHPEQHLAGMWDDDVKARVRAAFAGTGRADAEGTTTRVLALLDRQASAYAAMRVEVCEASRAGKQRPEVLDLRDACLTRRRGELAALASLFAEKPDPQVLDRAVAAAAGLHPVAYCADTEALTARVHPPEDPVVRARVAALQPRVDRLETLYATGKYRDGLAFASPLLVETQAVPYPPLDAQARFWRGRLQEGAGDFEAAKASLREAALAAAEGGDDVLIADAWARLLFVAAERQQHFEEASVIRSLGVVAVTRAHDPRILATWVNAEGLLLWRMGKSAEAKACHERALALREKVLGPDHPDVASTLNNLGLALQAMGDFQEAVATQERALALRERVLGPDHPDVAQSLSNLGFALDVTGDYARSVAIHERALALREKVLGPDHPDVALSLDNLAVALSKTGDLPQALAAEERALALRERTLGADHPMTAQSLNDLANLLLTAGDLPRAVATYERAESIFARALGPDHRENAMVLDNLGAALHEMGDDTRAKVTHERALAILEKALGPEHPDLAIALTGLGRAQVGLGQLDAALSSLTRAGALLEKGLGPSHTTLLGLGELSLARRRPEQAVPLLERALALADAEDKPLVLATLAEALWESGQDRPRARALAEQARAAYQRAGHKPRVDRTTRWLAGHQVR
jgi:serine/threonine-protein kinase